jgi:DNA repair exonuclease SbcCD ATPase subunit
VGRCRDHTSQQGVRIVELIVGIVGAVVGALAAHLFETRRQRATARKASYLEYLTTMRDAIDNRAALRKLEEEGTQLDAELEHQMNALTDANARLAELAQAREPLLEREAALESVAEGAAAEQERLQVEADIAAFNTEFDALNADVERLTEAAPVSELRKKQERHGARVDAAAKESQERTRAARAIVDELTLVFSGEMADQCRALIGAVTAYAADPSDKNYEKYEEAERAYLRALRTD